MFTKQFEHLKRPPVEFELEHEDYKLNLLAHLKILQRQKHSYLLKNRAKMEKIRTARMDFRDFYINGDDLSASKFETALETLQKNEADEKQEMPVVLKRKLEGFIPKVWKQLYTREYGVLLNEVREHFQQTLLSPCCLKKFSFRFAGRTQNYEKFLKVQRKMTKQLLITREPVRTVLDFAVRELPQNIFNFKEAAKNCHAVACPEEICERKSMAQSSLFRSLNKVIDQMDYHIRYIWYQKLIEVLKGKMQSLKNIEPRLLTCMEGLIKREITRIKTVWLSELLNELSNVQTAPMLHFQLKIEAYEIQLNPSLSTVAEMYASLATNVANIGVQKLYPLKLEMNMISDIGRERFIDLGMNKIYLAEFVADLKEAIKESYKPVNDFLDNFKSTYNCIIQSADFDHYDFITASHPFLHYVVKMMNYSNHKKELQHLPQCEYFVMATVFTTPAVSQLISAAKNFMKLVADEMTSQHIDYLKTICSDYEQIKNVISKEPESTEELIEIKNFLNLIKKQHLVQLEERVQWARHIGCQLQTLTEFSQYHWNLYNITLNWVHDMDLVCEESAAQLQYFTELFKQYLENRINKFNDAIEDLYSKMDLLNNVTDLSELKGSGEHAVFYRNIITRLQELEDCMRWINKEEGLLNVIKTFYPKLDKAELFVSKFH